ncbi:MAG: hypothetical protein E6H91_09825 [Chloroflexi bacterium]|nr:MAG: hypothetical protein E6H91_09825 [Chloroflexota bacterium]
MLGASASARTAHSPLKTSDPSGGRPVVSWSKFLEAALGLGAADVYVTAGCPAQPVTRSTRAARAPCARDERRRLISGSSGLSLHAPSYHARVGRVRSLALAGTLLLAPACAATGPAHAASAVPSAEPSRSATVPPSPASASPSATLPDRIATVSLAEHFFDPALLTVKVGTTVTWRNVGQQVHDVNARDGSFHSSLLGPGGTFSYTFTAPGRYPYFCVPHEGDGMIGEVDVQ